MALPIRERKRVRLVSLAACNGQHRSGIETAAQQHYGALFRVSVHPSMLKQAQLADQKRYPGFNSQRYTMELALSRLARALHVAQLRRSSGPRGNTIGSPSSSA